GLGDPLDARDGALTVRAELQLEDEVLADLGVLDLPARDEALLLEDLRDVRLDLGVRHRHRVVVRRVRVPQTRKHVCDRISHGHKVAFGLSRRGFQVPIPLLDPRRGGCGAVDLRRSKSYGRQGAQPSKPKPWRGGPLTKPFAYRELQVSPSRGLPGALGHARQLATVSHLTKAHAAQAELAVHGVGTAAALAARVATHAELGLASSLCDQSLLRHLAHASLKGKPR